MLWRLECRVCNPNAKLHVHVKGKSSTLIGSRATRSPYFCSSLDLHSQCQIRVEFAVRISDNINNNLITRLNPRIGATCTQSPATNTSTTPTCSNTRTGTKPVASYSPLMAEMASDGDTPRDEFAEYDMPEQRFLIPADFQASNTPFWEFRDLMKCLDIQGGIKRPAVNAPAGGIIASGTGSNATAPTVFFPASIRKEKFVPRLVDSSDDNDAASSAASAADEDQDAAGTDQESNEEADEDSDDDAEHEESSEESEEPAEEDEEESNEDEEKIIKDEGPSKPKVSSSLASTKLVEY